MLRFRPEHGNLCAAAWASLLLLTDSKILPSLTSQLSSGEGQPPEASAMAMVEDQEPERKIFSLIREKEELQQMLEHMRAEKEQLRSDLQESIERVGLAPWPAYSPSWPCLCTPYVGRETIWCPAACQGLGGHTLPQTGTLHSTSAQKRHLSLVWGKRSLWSRNRRCGTKKVAEKRGFLASVKSMFT